MLAALAVSIATAPAEWALYDARVPMRSAHPWPRDLVSVRMSEKDIAALGGWPLPAQSLVMLLDALHRAGTKTVVLDVFLGFAGTPADEAALAPSLAHTVTAITFDASHGRSPTADELRARMIPASSGPIVPPSTLSFPPETIANAVARLGHAGIRARNTGSVRASPPLVRVEGFEGGLPSQALAAVIEHHGIDPAAIRVRKGALEIPGRAPIALHDGETLLDLTAGSPPEFTVADLLNDRLGRRSLQGALAIVHVDTPEDRHASALGAATAGGDLLAAAIRTLEIEARPPRIFPAWAAIVVAGSLASVAMRVRGDRRRRLLACAVIEGAWLAAAFALVPIADVFLPVVPAIVVFAAGLAAIVLSDSASATGAPVAPS